MRFSVEYHKTPQSIFLSIIFRSLIVISKNTMGLKVGVKRSVRFVCFSNELASSQSATPNFCSELRAFFLYLIDCFFLLTYTAYIEGIKLSSSIFHADYLQFFFCDSGHRRKNQKNKEVSQNIEIENDRNFSFICLGQLSEGHYFSDGIIIFLSKIFNAYNIL